MAVFSLIISAILIILSILGWVYKPFTYWWVASIIAALVGIVYLWVTLKKPGVPIAG